ncbi:MAG: glycosyltransferase family 1 protein [Candidatus Gastranaerophilales bacterium]|nr:glycosyltransferase family 1 protein [Candidatus Gastranaerophilales bacterium]
MKKFFYDTSLNSKNIGGVTKTIFYLFDAINKITPEYKILGIQRKKTDYQLPPNVETQVIEFPYESTLWRNTIYPYFAFRNKGIPFYFPVNGNIPSWMPSSTPIITTFHDVLPLEIPGFFSSDKEEKKYIRKTQADIDRSDLIFTISEYSKIQLMKHFNIDIEPVVLLNAPTINLLPENIPESSDKGKYFLFNGRYDKRKGLDKLIKVFIYLHTTRKTDVKLYITGNPKFISEEFEMNMRIAHQLGAVQELGFVSDEEMASLLKNSVAMLYPSRYEGFGLPPLEAMQVGCPVVTEYSSALPEVCDEAAIYAEVDETGEYAQLLLKLIEDSNYRNHYIYKGFERVKHFSWEKSAQVFIENLETLNEE